MACYTVFCFRLPLPVESARWTGRLLRWLQDGWDNPDGRPADGAPAEPGFRDMLAACPADYSPGWQDLAGLDVSLADPMADGLVFATDDGTDVEAVAAFVQALARRFDLPPIGFAWATTCDRRRPDEFGGGAVYITPERVEWFTAADWLRRRLAEPVPGDSLADYRVRWEIDVPARDPVDAVRRALAVQRDPDSSTLVFEVIEPAGASIQIDLLEPTD